MVAAGRRSGRVVNSDDGTEGDAESPLSQMLGGRDLRALFTPRPEVTALLRELRNNPKTRAILDRHRTDAARPEPATESPPAPRPRPKPRPKPAPVTIDTTDGILAIVVDCANGMTQEEIADKHGFHVQTVRKRLKAAGVVMRTHGSALTEEDLNLARGLLSAGLSAREVGRRFGVAHTTLLRAIRRSDANPTG